VKVLPSHHEVGTQIDTQPDGTYRISSFFDIFTELSLDGGATWAGPTNGPVRVQLTPQANEQPTSSPNLPVTNAPYVSPQQWHALYANGIIITNVIHDRFTQSQPPPPPGGSQVEKLWLDGERAGFDEWVDKTFTPFSIQATSSVQVNSRAEQDTSNTRFFDTEMLSLNLSGGGLPPGVMIRESPSQSVFGPHQCAYDPGRLSNQQLLRHLHGVEPGWRGNLVALHDAAPTMSPRLPPKRRFFPNPNIPGTNSQYISPRQMACAVCQWHHHQQRHASSVPGGLPATAAT